MGSIHGMAQQVLSLDDALRAALENNYSIQIYKNDAAIAANNNRPGAAGMLPVISGTAVQDNQIIDSKQKFLNGTENNRSGAKNNSLNAGVELTWTIFDGMKMFATRNKLEELQKAGESRMKMQIEQTMIRVVRGYYDVMLAQQQLRAAEEQRKNSAVRRDLAKEKYSAGKIAKTELLKAEVDLNTDESNRIRTENQLRSSKIALNLLLARDLETPCLLPDSIPEPAEYKLDELMSKASSENTSLKWAKENQRVNELGLRELSAERMPTIQFRSGYNYSMQQSQAGFLQSAQSNGLHFGAGLSMNLFNGFDLDKRLVNAKLALKSSAFSYKDTLAKLQQNVLIAFNNLTMSKQLSIVEKYNVSIAIQNYEIASEQYQSGVITALELRDAQQNVLNTKLRWFSSAYESRMNEVELLRLTGELGKMIK